MTDNEAPTGGSESSDARQRWLDEVQEALDRTGDAVRTAWEATRESRMSALESAKQAAQELGEVLDKGIAAAKERWAATEQAAGGTAKGHQDAQHDQVDRAERDAHRALNRSHAAATPASRL